jgi:hypothetical protein
MVGPTDVRVFFTCIERGPAYDLLYSARTDVPFGLFVTRHNCGRFTKHRPCALIRT